MIKRNGDEKIPMNNQGSYTFSILNKFIDFSNQYAFLLPLKEAFLS